MFGYIRGKSHYFCHFFKMDLNSKSEVLKKASEVYQQEKAQLDKLTLENKKLRSLLEMQNQMISNQQELIHQVVQETRKYIEIEKERHDIQAKIKQETENLNSAIKDSEEVLKVVNEDMPEISKSKEDTIHALRHINLLKGIETIQTLIFNLSEKAMNEHKTVIDKSDICELILSINEVIDIAVQSGAATESEDQTIARHALVIGVLNGKRPVEE